MLTFVETGTVHADLGRRPAPAAVQ
jgi:hypothetical protein